ncbi:MAG: hypothetical protein IJ404_05280 [Clostridia bacterium]|nr:hypothetical protein [Clostridia bacterium]
MLVLGFTSAILSIKLHSRDFEYIDNGIILYGIEPNGLLRSHNTLALSNKTRFIAMHDSSAEIKALNGSRVIFKENGDSYEFTCSNGKRKLTVTLNGNCRLEDNILYFRRGETEIGFSEPIKMKTIPKRRGFEYEAEACLKSIHDLTSDSELLPLLLLVDGLKNAVFDEIRAEMINKLIPTMSEQNKKTAEAVIHRYYRAFGIEKR